MYSLKCLILLSVFNFVRGGNILALLPTPSISHQMPFKPIFEALALRGHRVTVMTTDPGHYGKKEYANLTEIDVKDISYKIMKEKFNFAENAKILLPTSIIVPFMDVQVEYMEKQLNTPDMKRLLDDKSMKFDLCFVELFGVALLGVKDYFNCSLIMLTSFNVFPDSFDQFGCPSNPFLHSHIYAVHNDEQNFLQRLHSTVIYLHFLYIKYWLIFPRADHFIKKHFGDKMRSIAELETEVDMIFINMNPFHAGIRPTTPAIVYLGSTHIQTVRSLPKEYKTILDNAQNGVIYFSLGSNVRSVDLPLEKRNAFLQAFRELPYTVLWKWENSTLSDKPNNVHISKWMPQQDILAHPNVRAFITQGGQQSMEEAIHFKVPLIGLPFIADQFLNVKKMVSFGIGVEFQFNSISKDIIKKAVTEIVNNQSYSQKISKLSDLIQDQPQTSVERAVWWTEYVLRHGGASHLRSPAVGVPFYQYFLLDIIAFALGCFSLCVIILIILIKRTKKIIISILSNQKSSQDKKHN